VLDDSTDETVDIIAEKVGSLQMQGLNIQHIRRSDRKGYKAGALAYGLQLAQGEFIAIFDADFLPHPDFLLQTIPWFSDEEIGVVQTRWGHVNKNYSLLTRLQAFGLDGHFTIEQGGRSHAGSFINFNGTGGVWRKKCIEDAGGWSADTLTEDLDLSYRAQMKGWRFKYLEEVEAPAELPILMPAIKSQQFRWNKGAAECARKHFGQIISKKVMNKPGFGFANKLHAFFHLFNSSIFVFLLFAAILSIPMLFIKQAHPELTQLFYAGGIFLIGFFAIGFFYWISIQQLYSGRKWLYYLKTYPLFLVIMMGLSLHNAMAVVEGLLGFKTPFMRTPKFNIKTAQDSWKKNIYISNKISPSTLFEPFLALYFFYGIYTSLQIGDFGLILFHLMLAVGFSCVAFYSIIQLKHD
jgi:cellulose synthase/poly-beta-1,6-N-acetylglucosamine synthase-like glycosyltransferase